MASKDFIQAINEHVMGDRSKFDALKERFQEDFYWCADKSIAAALAYLIAKDELEAKEEEEEEEEEPDAYDKVVEIINRFDNQRVNSLSPHSAADEIFTLIHAWLGKELTKVVYRDGAMCIEDVNLLFQPFIIEMPKA
jgi:hypothetical protein